MVVVVVTGATVGCLTHRHPNPPEPDAMIISALGGWSAMLIGAVIAALLLGFLAGLLSFKIKDRWCPHCGATTSDLARHHTGHAR